MKEGYLSRSLLRSKSAAETEIEVIRVRRWPFPHDYLDECGMKNNVSFFLSYPRTCLIRFVSHNHHVLHSSPRRPLSHPQHPRVDHQYPVSMMPA